MTLTRQLARAIAPVLTLTTVAAGQLDTPPAAADRLGAFTTQSLDLPAGAPQYVETPLELAGKAVTLRLFKTTVRNDAFQVLAPADDGTLAPVQAPPVRTYVGTASGMPGSRVAVTLTGGTLTGIIREASGATWGVQPAGDSGQHLVYSLADVEPGPWTCGGAFEAPGAPAQRDTIAQAAAPSGGLHVLELAADTDFQYVQFTGGTIDSAVDAVEGTINAVNAIYEPELGITHEITTIVVRTDEDDPYQPGGSPLVLLNQLSVEWLANHPTVPRDAVHLMTGQVIGGGAIGVAYLSAMCNSEFGIAISRANFTNVVAERVGVVAHELGHNWSAPHCNEEPDCQIMCSFIGGCTGGLTAFSNATKGFISSFVQTTPCVDQPNPTAVWSGVVTTDDGDAVVEQGESATVTLSLDFDPDVGGDLRGLAATIFDTLGGAGADSGQLTSWQLLNDLDSLTGDLTQTDGISLFETNAGQLTKFGSFSDADPIDVLQFEWAPDALEGAIASYSTNTHFLLAWEDSFVFDDTFAKVILPTDASIDIQVSDGADCAADCNDDGTLNILDFTCFQALFSAGEPVADCNEDSVLNILDFICYQASFEAGCP